jgi:hypothetical protein
MTEIDLSRLSPSDAATALRSYPRRYRALLQPINNDDDVEELAHRVGPEGASAVQLLSDVTRTLVILGEALRQIMVNPTPVVHAAVVDPARRQWDTPPPERLGDALALFTDEATTLADAIDRVPADGWTRTGSIAGGGTVSAIDVAREAVRVGRSGLADIERTLAAVRS